LLPNTAKTSPAVRLFGMVERVTGNLKQPQPIPDQQEIDGRSCGKPGADKGLGWHKLEGPWVEHDDCTARFRPLWTISIIPSQEELSGLVGPE
jgi:hypothetical protein